MQGDPYDLSSLDTPAKPAGGDPYDLSSVAGPAVETPEDPYDLTKATGRARKNQQDIVDNIARLKAIKPVNGGQAKRIQMLIDKSEAMLPKHFYEHGVSDTDRSATENVVRGLDAGFVKGLMGFDALVAKGATHIPVVGKTSLVQGADKFFDEANAQTEEFFQPEGKTGMAADVVGNIVGGAPGYGAAAKGVGMSILRYAPKSVVGRLVAAAAEKGAGRVVGAGSNVVTGLPINALQGLVAGNQDPDQASSPEEASAIRTQNYRDKLTQLAIGIGADALFGGLTAGKFHEGSPGDKAMAKEVPVISPDRQAALDAAKERAATRRTASTEATALRQEIKRIWQNDNPDVMWTKLDGKTKKGIQEQYKETARSNIEARKAPTTDPVLDNSPEREAYLQHIAELNEKLARTEGERNDAQRQAETDHLLDIGNARALERAAPAANKDDNLVYIFSDTNGQKSINDTQGYEVGDQFLRDSRDALVRAHQDLGIKEPRLFRYGGDEMVAIVPKDKAVDILNRMEDYSVRDYNGTRGSMSGAIYETLDEALSKEGKGMLASRKLQAKAVHGIPGRDAEEQSLIDAINTNRRAVAGGEAEPGVASEGGNSGVSGVEPGAQEMPPELERLVKQITDAGGLQTPEEMDALITEVGMLRAKSLPPDQYHAELADLADDFTPLSLETKPEAHSTAGPENQPPDSPSQAQSAEPSSGSTRNDKASETYLTTIKSKKPLEALTEKELNKLEDHLIGRLAKEVEGSETYAALQDDLSLLGENQARLNAASPIEPLPRQAEIEGGVRRPDFNPNAVETVKAKAAEEGLVRQAGEQARKLFKASLRTMNIDDLNAHIDDLHSRLSGMSKGEAPEYAARLDKAIGERTERFLSSQGAIARMPPGVLSGTAGFAYGYMTAEDDTDKISRALMWGAIGAGVGTLAGRMLARGGAPKIGAEIKERSPAELPGGAWQYEFRKHVVSGMERGKEPIPFLETMRRIYGGVVRRTYVTERYQESLGASHLPTHLNASKLAGMYGRWAGQTEAAIKYGPAMFDEFGNHLKLDALGVDDILKMVSGDVESLGELMAARAKIELGDAVKTSMKTFEAERMYQSMPENFHAAADEARKFSLAMADVMVDGGLLSQEGRAKFADESMYASLQRIFNFETGKGKVSSEKSTKVTATSENPLKARKGGSEALIKNPFEAMIESIPYYYRAAELNKIKMAFVEAWEAGGKDSDLMKHIQKKEIPDNSIHERRIQQIKDIGFASADAEAMVAALEPGSLDELNGNMQVHRNGVLTTYRVPKEIATAMKNLHTEDFGMLMKFFGYPTRMASKGITMNPYFIGKTALFDMWQATLNSQYGFRPGIDNIRGWLNIVRESPKYQAYLGPGGSHQSLYGTSGKTISTALKDVKQTMGSPLEVAVRQIKQLQPIEAYKTLAQPLLDAARIGEYLRALDHGATTIDAIAAARQVTANYSEIGAFSTMRHLQYHTMFLGPAIQIMDQAVTRMGINPFRKPGTTRAFGKEFEGRGAAAINYATKAFITITLPTLYNYAANYGDEEIDQLRQTQNGRKYWFHRLPADALGMMKGQIVKTPKSPLDGQVWGTSFEAAMDAAHDQDPQGLSQVLTAVSRDAAFNLLPTLGVIGYSLQANQNLGLGNNIVPVGDDQLSLEYQGADKATWLARSISSKLAPHVGAESPKWIRTGVTPAGVDFLINSIGGMLGQDAALTASQAVDYQSKGWVPALDELPVIKRVLQHEPTTSVRSVERFYDRLAKVSTAAADLDNLLKTDGEKAVGYADRNQHELRLVKMYEQARQGMADSRRAIVDIKNAPAGTYSQGDKKELTELFVNRIVQTATVIEEVTKEMDKEK